MLERARKRRDLIDQAKKLADTPLRKRAVKDAPTEPDYDPSGDDIDTEIVDGKFIYILAYLSETHLISLCHNLGQISLD